MFLDTMSLDPFCTLHAMARVYEIHCYQNDVFQYVVAKTNKLSEKKVQEDVDNMNHALGSEINRKGIKYVFVVPANSRPIGEVRDQNKRMKGYFNQTPMIL